MQYRIDPKTGNRLSILGFGCMRFPRDAAKAESMVVDAVNRGINYLDTAYLYPGNEEVVGHILAKHSLREKIYLATKLPIIMCSTYGDFDKFFNKSLERLKTNHIDYYLMHMITTPEQWNTLCDAGIEQWIGEKKAQGKIKQLGFSFHGKREDFVAIINARSWDFCMIQYNYLDINNQAGFSGMQYAASKGIPVMIMEPLLGGRLADIKLMPLSAQDVMNRAGGSLTPPARALRWIWNHEEVLLLLSGMSAQKELDENIATADTMAAPNSLNSAELRVINATINAFNEKNKISCTGCGYCIPCPRGVNVSGCFNSYNMSYNQGLFKAMKPYVMATAALTSKKGLASSCNGCGKCELQCPQGIPIAKSLKMVRKRLEPFWFQWGMRAVRWLAKVRAKKS